MADQFLGPLHLAHGAHPRGKEMCAMEAAAYLAGESHSDHPECVSPVIAAFMRCWNDGLPDAQRDMLKPWIVKCLHTRTTQADETTRTWLATDWLVRVHAPAWLDLAGLNADATALRNLPALTSSEIATAVQSVIEGARQQSAAAWDAAGAAAWDAAAWDAARDAARVAAWAAAWDAAGAAAWDAAWDAAGAAAWDAARAAAWDAARAAAWAAARAAAWDAARAAAWDAAWDAARAAAGAAAWDAAGAAAWDAARAAAGDAARAAAGARLAPTVEVLQASACELLGRMIAVGATVEQSPRLREVDTCA